MSIENRIDMCLTTDKQDEIRAANANLAASFDWLLSLAPEERRATLRAGDATEMFLQRAYTLAQQYPSILPAGMSVTAMGNDLATRTFLLEQRAMLLTLLTRIDDTIMVCGGEAFQAGLQVYHGAKYYGKGLGIDEQVKELARRFKRATASASGDEAVESSDA